MTDKPTLTLEEREKNRKAKLEFLMSIFPGDARVVNGLLMSEEVARQLPTLADSLRDEVKAFYSAAYQQGASTVAQEEKLMQKVADVLAWHTQLELALHDLRGALFYRFNVRVMAKPVEKSPEEAHRDEVRAETKAAIDAGKVETAPVEPHPQSLDVRAERAQGALQDLFAAL